MTLPQARSGERVQVKGRPIAFSLWPSRKGRKHYALQSLLFARDPWLVIATSISRVCARTRRAEALAYLEQSRDFFAVATDSGIVAARPLALYYSFMNLAKVFCLLRGGRTSVHQAQHGLSEQRAPGTQALTGAFLRAFPSVAGQDANVFDEFMQSLGLPGLATTTDYQLPVLLPQIVPGHRFWAQGAKEGERFISAHDIQFWCDKNIREMWLRIYFVADDLSRLRVSQQQLLAKSGLGSDFRSVACAESFEGRSLICLEQLAAHAYPGGYPADEFGPLVSTIRNRIWATVGTVKPYRKYYVYMASPADRPFVLPQMLSIYAITYYLGSITRYRPDHYDRIEAGAFGPWVREFITGQPLQFLYLVASECARQDVTRPAIL